MIKYPQIQDRDWLQEQLLTKSMRQIASEVGCSYSAVHYMFVKFELKAPRRTTYNITVDKSAIGKEAYRRKYPNGRWGADSSNWRGGVSEKNHLIRTSTEMKLWRKAVFERDNYTCVKCGKRGGDLEADHIKQFAYYPDLRFAIDNGQTLCKTCHKKTFTHSRKERKK